VIVGSYRHPLLNYFTIVKIDYCICIPVVFIAILELLTIAAYTQWIKEAAYESLLLAE